MRWLSKARNPDARGTERPDPPQAPAPADLRTRIDRNRRRLPSRRQEILTYADVVQFFVQHRPADPGPHIGALLCRRLPHGFEVAQVFLTTTPAPTGAILPDTVGRHVLCRTLDDELTGVLGDQDLVIFE